EHSDHRSTTSQGKHFPTSSTNGSSTSGGRTGRKAKRCAFQLSMSGQLSLGTEDSGLAAHAAAVAGLVDLLQVEGGEQEKQAERAAEAADIHHGQSPRDQAAHELTHHTEKTLEPCVPSRENQVGGIADEEIQKEAAHKETEEVGSVRKDDSGTDNICRTLSPHSSTTPDLKKPRHSISESLRSSATLDKSDDDVVRVNNDLLDETAFGEDAKNGVAEQAHCAIGVVLPPFDFPSTSIACSNELPAEIRSSLCLGPVNDGHAKLHAEKQGQKRVGATPVPQDHESSHISRGGKDDDDSSIRLSRSIVVGEATANGSKSSEIGSEACAGLARKDQESKLFTQQQQLDSVVSRPEAKALEVARSEKVIGSMEETVAVVGSSAFHGQGPPVVDIHQSHSLNASSVRSSQKQTFPDGQQENVQEDAPRVAKSVAARKGCQHLQHLGKTAVGLSRAQNKHATSSTSLLDSVDYSPTPRSGRVAPALVLPPSNVAGTPPRLGDGNDLLMREQALEEDRRRMEAYCRKNSYRLGRSEIADYFEDRYAALHRRDLSFDDRRRAALYDRHHYNIEELHEVEAHHDARRRQ
ncbi:unnamed protein product, partial [Amoebophrya sp. A25]